MKMPRAAMKSVHQPRVVDPNVGRPAAHPAEPGPATGTFPLLDPGPREAKRRHWPRHIGILSDYVRIPYATGSSFATQFLYREFLRRGHDVTIVGPRDPQATRADLPHQHVLLPSVALRNHPGVYLPLPGPRSLAKVANQHLDVLLGQTCGELTDLGIWLRRTQRVPFLCVNTFHMPTAYQVLLPDNLLNEGPVDVLFRDRVVPWLERHASQIYNQSDGLIVLSSGFVRYWRDRGVTVPIYVLPRSVEPRIFNAPAERDPFAPAAKPGGRLLAVCRHSREKNISRLLRIFARWIAPQGDHFTLTLVGDGPDHDTFRQEAESLGVADRVFFPGEYPVTQVPQWYRHADLFLYTSLSETYGQVVSEAMWCGLPVVAFADGMGVSDQVQPGEDGVLVPPGPDEDRSDWRFAQEALNLLRTPGQRQAFALQAAENARRRADPDRCVERYYGVFDEARQHLAATAGELKGSIFARVHPLARWTWVQAATAGLGWVRSPTTLNRHGRSQPSWDPLTLPDRT